MSGVSKSTRPEETLPGHARAKLSRAELSEEVARDSVRADCIKERRVRRDGKRQARGKYQESPLRKGRTFILAKIDSRRGL